MLFSILCGYINQITPCLDTNIPNIKKCNLTLMWAHLPISCLLAGLNPCDLWPWSMWPLNFGQVWILVKWILVKSQTYGKRCIWAHRAYAQVGSKIIWDFLPESYDRKCFADVTFWLMFHWKRNAAQNSHLDLTKTLQYMGVYLDYATIQLWFRFNLVSKRKRPWYSTLTGEL